MFLQVFIRELISNASDALEKLRYLQLQGETIVDKDIPLEIHLATDENKKTFTIQVSLHSVLYLFFCSTTGVTKAVVCVILSVGTPAANRKE